MGGYGVMGWWRWGDVVDFLWFAVLDMIFFEKIFCMYGKGCIFAFETILK